MRSTIKLFYARLNHYNEEIDVIIVFLFLCYINGKKQLYLEEVE